MYYHERSLPRIERNLFNKIKKKNIKLRGVYKTKKNKDNIRWIANVDL